MQRFRRSRRRADLPSILAGAAASLAAFCLPASSDQPPIITGGTHALRPALPVEADGPLAIAPHEALQLEVFLNGKPKDLVVPFAMDGQGLLFVAPEELGALGLDTRNFAPGPDGLIALDAVSGLDARYDTATQAVHLTAEPAAMKLSRLNVGPQLDDTPATPSATGAALNYTLFGSAGDAGEDRSRFRFEGISGAAEARVFGPWGTLAQTGLATRSVGFDAEVLRLDTVYSYSDHDRLLAYEAGDLITRGPGWTRPVRLGGLQVARRFDLRPDLITRPIPTVSGTAQAPSTLDLYVDGVRTFTAETPAGPFALDRIPVVDGSGVVSVVVRDALGRETVSSLPFYASSDLLAPGLTDFAAEVGFARRNYGSRSSDYDGRPAVSAAARRGLTPSLTVEGQAEAMSGLLKLGAGAVSTVGTLGLASAALAVSNGAEGLGALVDLGVEARRGLINFSARMQRTIGDFQDLASWTAPDRSDPLNAALFRAPRAIDQAQVSAPLPFNANLSLSYTGVKQGLNRVRALGLALSLDLGRVHLHATALRDLGRAEPLGFQLSLTAPLGRSASASTGVTGAGRRSTVYADASQQATLASGDLGWRVRASEGDVALRQAGLSYEAAKGRVEAEVQSIDGRLGAWGQLNGGVAFLAGRPFLSRRLDGPFAVVDAGVSGLKVLHENRFAGVTSRNGLLLIPGLVANQSNRVAIDATGLPLDAELAQPEARLKPRDGAGVLLRFRPRILTQTALVVLTGADGQPLPAGARGRLKGSEDAFIVGYDGEAFIRDLSARNAVTVELPDGRRCEAEFRFQSVAGEQVRIADVTCRALVIAKGAK